MSGSDMRWAFVGDLQIPYHDRRAVTLWFEVMKWWNPHIIDLVGDIDDQLEYSSFSDGGTDEFISQLKTKEREHLKASLAATKAYDKLETDEERQDFVFPEYDDGRPTALGFIEANAQGAKDFYTGVREQHPDADINASLGNHDIRIYKYMDRKMPELNEHITPNRLWGLDDLGITWSMYSEPPTERYAGIYVHHGATTSSSGLAVKSDIESYGISLVRGHDHRGGVVYKSYPMTGNSLVGMGTGHMCDVKGYGLQYTINPSWEQGFGIGHIVDGKAHLQFVPIRNTDRGLTCVVDGKVFVA